MPIGIGKSQRLPRAPVSAPPRTTDNYRDYTSPHVCKLTFTRRGRNLGFSIKGCPHDPRAASKPRAGDGGWQGYSNFCS
jgi:hypothetical protein